MKCPVCKKKVDSLKTAIKNGEYISERCDSCMANFTVSAVYARKYERSRQAETYRKDLIQRYEGDKPNPEFIRNYPEESKRQWGEDILRV